MTTIRDHTHPRGQGFEDVAGSDDEDSYPDTYQRPELEELGELWERTHGSPVGGLPDGALGRIPPEISP